VVTTALSHDISIGAAHASGDSNSKILILRKQQSIGSNNNSIILLYQHGRWRCTWLAVTATANL